MPTRRLSSPTREIPAAKKGAYYKARSKRWLVAHQWQVGNLEEVRWIVTSSGARIPVKRDQFGSDLIAMNAYTVAFIQVKGGRTARQGVSAARRKFAEFTFPRASEQWIMLWLPRAREPEIIMLSKGLDFDQGDT